MTKEDLPHKEQQKTPQDGGDIELGADMMETLAASSDVQLSQDEQVAAAIYEAVNEFLDRVASTPPEERDPALQSINFQKIYSVSHRNVPVITKKEVLRAMMIDRNAQSHAQSSASFNISTELLAHCNDELDQLVRAVNKAKNGGGQEGETSQISPQKRLVMAALMQYEQSENTDIEIGRTISVGPNRTKADMRHVMACLLVKKMGDDLNFVISPELIKRTFDRVQKHLDEVRFALDIVINEKNEKGENMSSDGGESEG